MSLDLSDYLEPFSPEVERVMEDARNEWVAWAKTVDPVDDDAQELAFTADSAIAELNEASLRRCWDELARNGVDTARFPNTDWLLEYLWMRDGGDE